jgi:hypothetical protein
MDQKGPEQLDSGGAQPRTRCALCAIPFATPTPHCIVPFRFTGAASASGCWVQKRHGIMLR